MNIVIKTAHVKTALKVVAGIGSARITNDVIRNNTAPNGSTFDKIVRYTGAVALGGIVGSAVDNHVDATVNKLTDAITLAKIEHHESN